MHNADIQMWHMCACGWLYQYVIFKYPRVLARVCVNLPSHSCEQAWCCIQFCSSVYRDEQYHFLSRWQCLFRDFTCVRLLLYWLTVWLSCCVQHYYRCNCFDCLHHATSWQHFELQRPCLTVALSSINLSHSLAVCLSLALYFSSMASHCLMGNVH